MFRASSLMVVVLVLAMFVSAPHATLSNKLVKVPLRKFTIVHGDSQGQPLTVYFVRAGFGTPSKPFNMLVDVNGREVWLTHRPRMGPFPTGLKNMNGYCRECSTTSLKEQHEIYKINYLETELTGEVYRDEVGLEKVAEGAHNTSQSVWFQQRFLLISSASNDRINKYDVVDGVLALGPQSVSETGADSVTVAMRRANLISRIRFCLEIDPEPEGERGGELTIGGIDVRKYRDDLKYHQLSSRNSWELGLQMVMLGADSMNACSSSSNRLDACIAVLSTTTNYIHGPSESIRVLLRLLGVDEGSEGRPLREIDCSKVANSPTLTFVIDGTQYPVPPTSYIKRKIDSSHSNSSTCFIGLQSNLSDNRWELGTSFLLNFYTVFDMENLSVAFGRRK